MKREQDHNTPELPLPRPRSPAQLDARILAHARDRAPEKSRAYSPAWARGLAAAGIVGIAVLITDPRSPAPVLEPPAADYQADRDIALTSEAPAASSPAPLAEQSARFKTVRKAKSQQAVEDREEEAMAAARDIPRDATLTSPRVDYYAAPAAGLALEEAVVAADKMKVDIPSRVQACTELLAAGKEEQAREAYRILLEDCPRCDLPDTLDAAIKRLNEERDDQEEQQAR